MILVNTEVIPGYRVLETKGLQAFLYYNQAYAFTAYLRGLGTAGDWREFLGHLATQDLEQAISETYGIESIDELERGFLAAYDLRH